MLTSHAFSPRTSIRSRKAAIDSAFVCPLYRGRVGVDYKVLHVVALCAFAAFFKRRFHSISDHLAMHIVDIHLCQQPPILYCRSNTLPAQRRVSTWCYSSSRISCSLSPACRRRASQQQPILSTISRKGSTDYSYNAAPLIYRLQIQSFRIL